MDSARRLVARLWLASCLLLFFSLAWTQLDTFRQGRTGTSVTRETPSPLPFPAVTVCDSFVEDRRFLEDKGIISAFGASPVFSNPSVLYPKMAALELNVLDQLWEYQFTLDEVIPPRRKTVKGPAGRWVDNGCRVGRVPCGHEQGEDPSVFRGRNGSQSVTLEVPAGTWTTRLLADSDRGATHFCHTLVPNVTADFSRPSGSDVCLVWSRRRARLSKYWRVYLHDRREHVVLSSYSMEHLPSLFVPQMEDDGGWGSKRRARMRPVLTRLVSVDGRDDDNRTCVDDDSYSQNLCRIRYAWDRRLEEVEALYGDNLTCVPAGVLSSDPRRYPVCDHFDRLDDGRVGYRHLIMNVATDGGSDESSPGLASPPLGAHMAPTSACPPRCESYSYELTTEPVSEHEGLFDECDLHLYLSSPAVEVWTEYRLDTPVGLAAGVGGTMGLVLGTSIFSAVTAGAAAISKALKAFREDEKEEERDEEAV